LTMAYKLMFVTLGCAKNLVDSEKMLEVLAEYGFSFTDDPAEADAAVINTCTFIDEAKSESIDHILDIASYKGREKGHLKALVVAGCMAERYREQLYDEIPEIDAVIGLSGIQDIASVVYWVLNGNRKLMLDDIPMVRIVKPKAYISADNYLENKTDFRHRRISLTPPFWSYLKIADGCDNPCSFCILPKVRGRFRSVPMDLLVARARRLAEDGVRELNLIAQDTSNYGRDLYGKPRLAELISRLSELDGIKWLRILYTYPLHVGSDLVDVIAKNPKVCKYIDVPLQHASDNVLKAMRRGMDRAGTEKFIDNLREKIPGVCIRTTFIIGHPHETMKDVETLAEFVREKKLEKVGFFRYSNEEGTASYGFDKQVSEAEKKKRLKFVGAEYDRVLKEMNSEMVGRELEALVEDFDGKTLLVRSYREAPEVDGFIKVRGKNVKMISNGSFIGIRIIKTARYDLVAEAL